MNERETIKWVNSMDGRHINALESAELDDLLNTDSQAHTASLVGQLENEPVSMQWRSSLNEKLIAMTPPKKGTSPLLLGLRALVGVGVVAVATVALYSASLSKPAAPTSSVDADRVASALLSEHRQSVASSEIAGPGIADGEPEKKSEDGVDPDADADSL